MVLALMKVDLKYYFVNKSKTILLFSSSQIYVKTFKKMLKLKNNIKINSFLKIKTTMKISNSAVLKMFFCISFFLHKKEGIY